MSDDVEGTTCADRDLAAVEDLVERADGDKIWQVLDHAQEHRVSVAEAYRAVMGDRPGR